LLQGRKISLISTTSKEAYESVRLFAYLTGYLMTFCYYSNQNKHNPLFKQILYLTFCNSRLHRYFYCVRKQRLTYINKTRKKCIFSSKIFVTFKRGRTFASSKDKIGKKICNRY
jgi:hypothetical protein